MTKRWRWICGLALLACGSGGGDGPAEIGPDGDSASTGTNTALTNQAIATFEGVYQVTQMERGCDAEGEPVQPPPQEFLAAVGATVNGRLVLVAFFCPGLNDCRDVAAALKMDLQSTNPGGESFVFDSQSQHSTTHLSEVVPTWGVYDGLCVSGFRTTEELVRSGEELQLLSLIEALPDKVSQTQTPAGTQASSGPPCAATVAEQTGELGPSACRTRTFIRAQYLAPLE